MSSQKNNHHPTTEPVRMLLWLSAPLRDRLVADLRKKGYAPQMGRKGESLEMAVKRTRSKVILYEVERVLQAADGVLQVRTHRPWMRVVGLSSNEDPSVAAYLLSMGFDAYVWTGALEEDLYEALGLIMKKAGRYVSPWILKRI